MISCTSAMSAACCSASMMRTVRRHAHVDADADHHLRRAGGFAAHLDENSAELALLPDQVVRPLQTDAFDAQTPERAHGRDADRETQRGERRRRFDELPAHRHADAAAERRDPAAPAPAAARVLDLGDADVRRARRIGGVLGDVAIGRIHGEQHVERIQQRADLRTTSPRGWHCDRADRRRAAIDSPGAARIRC